MISMRSIKHRCRKFAGRHRARNEKANIMCRILRELKEALRDIPSRPVEYVNTLGSVRGMHSAGMSLSGGDAEFRAGDLR